MVWSQTGIEIFWQRRLILLTNIFRFGRWEIFLQHGSWRRLCLVCYRGWTRSICLGHGVLQGNWSSAQACTPCKRWEKSCWNEKSRRYLFISSPIPFEESIISNSYFKLLKNQIYFNILRWNWSFTKARNGRIYQCWSYHLWTSQVIWVFAATMLRLEIKRSLRIFGKLEMEIPSEYKL